MIPKGATNILVERARIHHHQSVRYENGYDGGYLGIRTLEKNILNCGDSVHTGSDKFKIDGGGRIEYDVREPRREVIRSHGKINKDLYIKVIIIYNLQFR